MFARLILLLMVLGAGGCGKFGGTMSVPLTVDEEPIIGRWKVDIVETGGNSATFMMLLGGSGNGLGQIEFKRDKTYVYTLGEIPVEGTWTTDNGSFLCLIKKVDGEKPQRVMGFDEWMSDKRSSKVDTPGDFFTKLGRTMALEFAQEFRRLKLSTDRKSLSIVIPPAANPPPGSQPGYPGQTNGGQLYPGQGAAPGQPNPYGYAAPPSGVSKEAEFAAMIRITKT